MIPLALALFPGPQASSDGKLGEDLGTRLASAWLLWFLFKAYNAVLYFRSKIVLHFAGRLSTVTRVK